MVLRTKLFYITAKKEDSNYKELTEIETGSSQTDKFLALISALVYEI